MTSAVKSGTSDQPFNRLLPGNPLSKVKIPEILGCCSNLFKFSYVISAPLHMKGFWEFWAKDHTYAFLDRLAVSFDLLVHLGLWFVALGLEIWSNVQEHRGPDMLSEVANASLWTLIVAIGGILVAQLFAMTSGGQEAGKLFPSTFAAIVGGAYASILFSVIWILSSPTWNQMNTQYTMAGHDGVDDHLKMQRQYMLWAMALKTFAVVTLKKNADFWGPCVIDSNRESEEKTVQYMKENPGMDNNA